MYHNLTFEDTCNKTFNNVYFSLASSLAAKKQYTQNYPRTLSVLGIRVKVGVKLPEDTENHKSTSEANIAQANPCLYIYRDILEPRPQARPRPQRKKKKNQKAKEAGGVQCGCTPPKKVLQPRLGCANLSHNNGNPPTRLHTLYIDTHVLRRRTPWQIRLANRS